MRIERVDSLIKWSLEADTPAHSLNPTVKWGSVLATVLTAFAVGRIEALPILAVPYVGLAAWARPPKEALLVMVVPPSVFLVVTLAAMSPWEYIEHGTEGLRHVALYSVRGFTDLTALVVTVVTTPINATWETAAALAPPGLAQTFLVFHGSLYGVLRAFRGILVALTVRGRPKPSLGALGAALATVLARSVSSAERMEAAIEVRGGSRPRPRVSPRFGVPDLIWAVIVVSSCVVALALGRG